MSILMVGNEDSVYHCVIDNVMSGLDLKDPPGPRLLSLAPSSKSTQFTVSLSYPISIALGHNKAPTFLTLQICSP